MKLQLIRNATLRLTYAGHTFVIDPYLAPKDSLPSYAGIAPNPRVELPISPQAVIEGIEMVVVSHLHTDHFDPLAQELLPQETPILCQPENEAELREKGFQEVRPVTTKVAWQTITIRRTPGRHGLSEAILRQMGPVAGFVFEAEDEPTVYWAGDTVWYDEIRANIGHWQPEIIITHSGGAIWGEDELIVMDAGQTVAVCKSAPEATVVATHLEALDHCPVSRAELRQYARQHGIRDEQLRIPEDGAVIEF